MRGFSLIETIIALAIMFVTVMIFGVALSSLPLLKTARNQNLAYHVAAKKMEELRNTSFTSLPPSSSFSDPGLASLASSTASFLVVDYQGSSQIKKTQVTVSWYEQGVNRSIILETLMTANGLNKP